MKRLGVFSGKIYDEDYDTNKIEECCFLITSEQAQDKDFCKVKIKRKNVCLNCMGCPVSQKENNKTRR